MFFSKKVQEAVEQRESYRKRQTPHQDIAVHVITPSGTFQGDFRDLSVQGVGVSFRLENDPGLASGDVIEVAIKHGLRDEVCTPARAVYSKPETERNVRYGFQFINVGNLYSQLDTFYAQLFNRRGSPRVRPALEQKVFAKLTWRSHVMEALISEVSATGVGLALPLADAYQLQSIERVRVTFTLPGVKGEFSGEACIENRKKVGTRAFLGLSFDFASDGTLSAMSGELAGFVDMRMTEMEGWESGWG